MVSSPLVSADWLESHLADPDLRVIEVCTCAMIRPITRGTFRARCGSIGNRRAGTKPIAISSRPRRWRSCSAAWASARSRHSCCTAIPFNTAVTPSGPSPWPGTKTCGCSTAGGENGSWRGGRCRAPCRAFPLSPIRRRRETSSMRVGRGNVRENLRQPRRLLLDVRSPEEYTGKRVSEYSFAVDHGAERTGRIPGAVHLYFRELLNEDDSFKSPDQLRLVLAAAGVAPEKFDDVVCYCRLSHRATIAWIALSQFSATATSRSTTAHGPNGAALSATRSRSSEPAPIWPPRRSKQPKPLRPVAYR